MGHFKLETTYISTHTPWIYELFKMTTGCEKNEDTSIGIIQLNVPLHTFTTDKLHC